MLNRIALFFLPLFSCLSAFQVAPVIINTDCSLDDAIAIVYLAQNPRVDVKGIVTVGEGMAHWETGATNILNVLHLIGRSRIPVSLGERKSMSPVGSYPSSWRQQADDFAGIKLPESPYHSAPEKGPDFIIDLISKHEEKITLCSIGPLTNIALVLEKKPELKEKIERIFIMGGALSNPGKLVEYNIFLDAFAAQVVFDSGVPITLIPSDVALDVPPKPFYAMLSSDRTTPSANLVYEILNPSTVLPRGLWPALTAALITNPEIGRYRELNLSVNLHKGDEYGQLRMSKEGSPVRALTQVDTQAFYEILLSTLNRNPNLHADHVKTD